MPNLMDLPKKHKMSHSNNVTTLDKWFRRLKPLQLTVKRYLTPPAFADDDDKTQLSQSLYYCLLLSLLSSILVTVADLIFAPFPLSMYLYYALIFIVILIGLALVRRGVVKPIGILFPFFMWLISTLSLSQSGGVYTATFGSSYVVVVFFAGILFGFRAALGYALLCVLSGIGLGYGIDSGILPLKPAFSPWLPVMVQSGFFLIVAPLLGLTTGSIMGSLKRARSELEARKKYEEALRESREWLQNMLAKAPAVLFSMTPSGDFPITYMSENSRLVTSFEAKEFTDNPFFWGSRIHPEDAPAICAQLNSILELEEIGQEYRFLQQDNTYHWLYNELRLIRDAEGNPLQIFGSSIDITERKKAEEALRENEELYRSLFNNNLYGVILANPQGRLIAINPAAEELTGWAQSDAIGLPLTQVFNVLDTRTRQPISNPLAWLFDAASGVEHIDPVILMVPGSTEEKYISFNVAPLHSNKDGSVMGIVLAFLSVTEKYKLEEERRKAKNLESLGVLAGGIAHDFNNLLTAIMGNLSLLKMDAVAEDEVSELLDEAEKATIIAKELAKQLLTFARGGAPIKKITQLKDLIRDTTTFVLRGTKIRGDFELPDNLWPVEIDQGQISQVLQNLVLNSLQATPEEGIVRIEAKNIEVRENEIPLLTPGKYLAISVKDQGKGIKPEDLPRIFDPYFTTKEKGKGLGLAISYSIIKRHGGHIVAESELDKGTTFYIYLPVTSEEVPDNPDQLIFSPTRQRQGRVLIMDDELMVRQMLEKVLHKIGYETEQAADGTEALACYFTARKEGKPFDLIIIDLTIPGGMGGHELIKRLREIDPEVKALVSSGYSNDPILTNYQEFGFRGVLSKPYSLPSLQQVLEKVLA